MDYLGYVLGGDERDRTAGLLNAIQNFYLSLFFIINQFTEYCFAISLIALIPSSRNIFLIILIFGGIFLLDFIFSSGKSESNKPKSSVENIDNPKQVVPSDSSRAATGQEPESSTQSDQKQPTDTVPVPLQSHDKETINHVREIIDNYLSAAMNNRNLETLLSFYSDEVDCYSAGNVNKDFIRNDKKSYYKKWTTVSATIVNLKLTFRAMILSLQGSVQIGWFKIIRKQYAVPQTIHGNLEKHQMD